jgi:hypothetical protein
MIRIKELLASIGIGKKPEHQCALTVPGTFYACGEGEQFCSDECWRAKSVKKIDLKREPRSPCDTFRHPPSFGSGASLANSIDKAADEARFFALTEAIAMCEDQGLPGTDDNTLDEYHRGQKRGVADCVEVLRRLQGPRCAGMTCEYCGKPGASQEDEGSHNTGECGCAKSKSLCWREWWLTKCQPEDK